MAVKIRHLQHRDGRYFARVSIPSELRTALGKTELLTALGADRKLALRKLPAAVAEMQGLISVARDRGKGPIKARKAQPMSPEQIARHYYSHQLAADEEIRNIEPAYTVGFLDEQHVAALKRAAAGSATNDEITATIGRAVGAYRALRHTKVKEGSPEWRGLARLLAGAQIEVFERIFERDEGNFTGKPSLPALTEQDRPIASDPKLARMLQSDSAKPLSDIVETFNAERKATPSTNREYVVAVKMLEEQLGEKRPLYLITRQDMHGFKRALSELPSNYTKRFPDRTIPEAISDNKKRAKPYPVLNPITINDKWLARIHAIFGWCVRNDLIPDNPSTGIKVEAIEEAEDSGRTNFSPDDLGRIFGGKFFDDDKKVLGERQWAMLIALFGGHRASELAQTKLDSVRTERGILVFAVEEATKNKNSQRLVPVHSKLIELGLEKHIKALRKNGIGHLFPEWYAKGMAAKEKARSTGGATLNHYFPRFIPKRFNDGYLPAVGIHDGRKAWHSFRHTFKTGLKRAGVSKSMRDDLAGHADSSAGAIYEHGSSVEAMKEAIEKLEFDGFAL